MFDFLKDKALVVWDDTQPCVVKYNGETVKSLSAYKKVTEETNPIQYSNEYKQKLFKLQINGRTVQDGTPTPETPVPIHNANDSRLPIGYQEVEYIQNTGTQYLNTGVFASENNSFEVKAQLVHTDTTSQTVWGGRQSATSGSNQLHFVRSNGLLQFACGNNVVANKTYDTNLHIFKSNKNILYVDGERLYSAQSAQITTQNEVYLFATNTNGELGSYSGGSLKIYYCKIWNKDTLIRDFVPCYRMSDGATGMYDLVNGTFYTNSGTGEFVKGNNVGMSLELRGKNLFNRPDVTMVANNVYYKNLSGGGFVLQPNTTYTVSFDYEFISVNETEKPYWSIGRGVGGYATDIKYTIAFPNFTKGITYYTFTTPSNLGTSNKLFFRVPRGDKRITCEVKLSNFMLNYGEQALPFEPYFEPVTIAIPPSVTVGSSTIPLRFARVEDKADYIEVNRLDGTVKYVRNIAYSKLPHADMTYTYIGMKGVSFPELTIEQTMTRAKGICTHTSKIGNYVSTEAKNALWLGVNTTVVYWVGILDTLGFTTVEEFNTWFDEQEAQGTPVELIYQRKTPVTTDITSTDLGQALLNLANSTQNATIIISAKSYVDPTLVAECIRWGGNL